MKTGKKKFFIVMIAGGIVGGMTLLALLVILALYFLFGGSPEVTEDITQYEEMLVKYENIHTGFITFPEKLPESASDTSFYFSFQDTWDDPTCEVFLQCTYSPEDYAAEVARLDETKKVFPNKELTLLRDDVGVFNYPAYIAVDKMDYSYEYALLTGDNQITYVFVSFMTEDNLKMDKKYLPSDYYKADYSKSELEILEGYSIYLQHVEVTNGRLDWWEFDYSR